MLENLKKMIRDDSNPTSVMEAAADRLMDDDSDIRDAFLIDKDGVTIGAEEDPEVEKFIERIPVYDDEEEISEAELEEMVENYIPEMK